MRGPTSLSVFGTAVSRPSSSLRLGSGVRRPSSSGIDSGKWMGCSSFVGCMDIVGFGFQVNLRPGKVKEMLQPAPLMVGISC